MITMSALMVKMQSGCMSELVVKFLVGRMVVIDCKIDVEAMRSERKQSRR